ncbi:hypothetical protein [Sphingomonas glacialis]|uniref:Stability/partitioning determinant n=1 Tax=Sphingomonas glacialis TaxID=658225 RepID=A0ABQ3L8J7_9SPHN|nr:hypothetical protein [Sphingomonas glacialis]GHH08735.1 hypothetical protein GCM10008023_04530 [Sphingomonas glacialis]
MSMFGNPKPTAPKATASLSSTLLARKGMAKPAMRPQGFGGFGAMPGAHDDLGWNDMGDTPPVPPVLVQREVLREEFAQPVAAPEPVVMPEAVPVAAEPEPAAALEPEPARLVSKPVSVATATRIGRETSKKHNKKRPKSAFTLRLDEDRHLRLRLASALHNASAQSLVTEALDQFLQTLPEVENLVRQLPTRAQR